MRLACLVCFALCIGSGNAIAQVTFEGCVDIRGLPVASVLNYNVPDVAMANLAPNGAPVIQYNPMVLARLSAQTRVFFYAHECAHHALGHAFMSIPFQQEQDADCWAIRTLVHRGILNSGDDVTAVQRDLSFSPGDWTHVPGPQRQFNLRACLR